MNELALFAGAGGGLLASRLLGWTTVGAVEIERYPRGVLLQRQRDGLLDHFPVWDDVRTFDGKPWRGLVDVVSGGFPCQDISIAGTGRGLAGDRSSLWFEYLRIVEEIRPRFVFAENSPNLRTRGLGTVLSGLTSLGYDIRWGVLGAGHIGANHKRDRMWVLAHSDGSGREEQWRTKPTTTTHETPERGRWWSTEPDVGRVDHGVASRVDRLRALGNGQVPGVAATAFRILSEGWT